MSSDLNSLDSEYPSLQITVVDASDCLGLSSVRNRGIRSSLGEKLLCLDDDDVAGDSYISTMSRALDRSPFVMARIELDLLNKAWRRDVRSVPQEYGPGSGMSPWGYAGTLGFRREVFVNT